MEPTQDPLMQPNSILRDRSFNGMLLTQFLGVFNDNVFKQIILFICVDFAVDNREDNLQGVATVVFAAPFILLSGSCGYLADLFSKRSIIVLSKVLEIVVMTLGLCAFLTGNVTVMLCVLFLMGSQSALFGPAKYGILPELFEEKDLPKVNGIYMMTMFLAIILGFTAAGALKSWVGDDVWIASIACIAIAIVGTLTSLMIRPTPIAHPELKFHWSAVIVSHETQVMLRNNRLLLLVLGATSLFWLTGGVVYPPAINDLGRLQFQLSEAVTGQLAACTGLGIAIGCGIAGVKSEQRFDARLVRLGSIGMLFGLILLALPGGHVHTTLLGVWGSAGGLIWLGMCAGLFSVPLQVYLQAKTPKEQKGRIIGAMNLANWIGIASAGVYYHFWNQQLARAEIPHNAMFGAAAILLLPIVFLYHPQSEELHRSGTEQSGAREWSVICIPED